MCRILTIRGPKSLGVEIMVGYGHFSQASTLKTRPMIRRF